MGPDLMKKNPYNDKTPDSKQTAKLIEKGSKNNGRGPSFKGGKPGRNTGNC
jgi:hypothetical protein